MKTETHSIVRNSSFAAAGLAAIAALTPPLTTGAPLHAAELEMSKEIIAVQIRKQGFACTNPQSATRDGDTKSDDSAWILKCDNATYKVHLVPKMAAKVERMPDEVHKDDVKGTSP
jgi:hypothetical protein